MSQPLEWHTEQRRVNDLLPLEINPRKISEARRMKMIESLQRFNLVDIPVVDFDGTIISGHQRMRALQAIGRGEEMIDVRMPNRQLTEKERKEYNVLANTHFGEFDEELFDEFFSDVDLAGLGLEEEDLFGAAIDEPEPVKLEAKEDDYEVPEVIVTDIVVGDLFEIGPHRLLCGDSTSADDVERVMGGEKADMIHTDPPYNVAYGTSKKPRHLIREIQNDNLNASEWEGFCKSIFSIFKIFNKGDIYMWGAPGPDGMKMRLWLVEMGAHWSATIIWKKDQLVLSPANYQRIYEPCFYGWFGKSSFVADRKQTELWEVERPKRSKEHPTMKPIELCAKPIENSSIQKSVVLDLFLGSGSTMVAAHQLNRRCYGIEIDPKYCQVIVDRMLRLDPTLEVKRNGHLYQPKKP